MCNTAKMDNALKSIDKFYYNLVKDYPEDYVISLVNEILKHKLIPYILTGLLVNRHQTVKIIYEGTKGIKEFTKLLKDNLAGILISAVRHEEAMKIALCIYNDMPYNKLNNKLNRDMLVCIYRHGLKYPSNMKACLECIKPHLTEDITIIQPFFFIKDEVSVIQEFFNRNKTSKERIFTHCLDCDSVDTFSKALKYYKMADYHYVMLSFPAFLDNIEKIDINNPETREKIIDEVTTYSRWDFLPFIFENMTLSEQDWIHFRIGFYQGFFNGIFLNVLLFCFNKYGIDFTNLKTAKKLTCNKDVKDVLVKYGVDKVFDISTTIIHVDNVKRDVCNLFNHFCEKDYQYVIFHMYASYAHLNKRFIRERDYINSLIRNGEVGFDSNLKIKWLAFMEMTDSLIEELKVTDILLSKYNSYIAVSALMEPIMANCFVNDIYREIAKLRTKSLIEEYASVVLNLRANAKENLKEVRNIISVDLEPETDWVLPVNPTLEDLFKEIYQYSCYEPDENPEEAYNLSVELKDKKCYKIMEEIQLALDSFIPLKSIKKILSFKGIIN